MDPVYTPASQLETGPVAFEKDPAGHALQTEAFVAPAAQMFTTKLDDTRRADQGSLIQ